MLMIENSGRILTYKEIDREEWGRLMASSETGTWFQGPEAYSFYESLPDLFQPFVLGVASLQLPPKGKRAEHHPSLQERTEDRPASGAVYEWFECGRNAEYKEQYPSVMATWAGIQWAKENGCARYDMMGAGEPGVPYGVRDFKSEFGGEMVEHGRFLCVNKQLLYKIGATVVKIVKKICVIGFFLLLSARPFPFGVGSLRNYVRTIVQTTIF